MKSRGINLITAFLMAVALGLILSISYYYSPSRILKLLGGEMPHGLIQLSTFFLFFFGILETLRFDRWVAAQLQAFKLNLLPEKEHFVLSSDEVNDIKLKTVDMQKGNSYLLLDIIKKACTKFRSNKSVDEALSIVTTQTEINLRNTDSEQNMIKYLAWAVQSIGLIGTVIGIGASLYAANEISNQAGIDKVTGLLSVSFDSTLIALILSIILLYYYQIVSEKVDKLHSENEEYVIENLINRIYAK